MRVAVVACAVLVAGCTHATPAAHPTPSPPATRRATPTPTPYVSAGSSCRLVHSSNALPYQTAVFLDARVGVVTQGGWLYRTTDGGKTWRWVHEWAEDVVVVPAGCRTLYAHGYRIFDRSDDGGVTWRHVSRRADIDGVQFVSPDVGFAVSGTDGPHSVVGTRDGGRTWRPLGLRDYYLGRFDAIDERLLFAPSEKHLLRSTDGGAHFLAVPGIRGGTVVVAPDRRHAWAYGYLGDPNSPDHGVWRSDDGGTRWRLVTRGRTYPMGEVRQYLDDSMAAYGSTLLVAGYDGRSSTVTVITGSSVRHVVLPGTEHLDGQSGAVSRLQWVDARHAYAVVSEIPTRLFATSDAGATWREVRLP